MPGGEHSEGRLIAADGKFSPPGAAVGAGAALDSSSSTRTAESRLRKAYSSLKQLVCIQTYSSTQQHHFIMAAGSDAHDADEVQISVKFVTKLGAEFRVPETPIVSADTTCFPGAAMHAVPHADQPPLPPCCRPCQPTSLAMASPRSSTTSWS